MLKWNDSTSYSQSDKERKPTSYTITINGIDVNIHRYVGCGDMLFVSSRTLKISASDLKTTNYDEAKEKALEYIKSFMQDTIKKYQEFIDVVNQE